ncbi:cytochrome c biogenesis protein CcdA [Winogradskyella sp.]|uniref:protein-disulfide reductase DsbD family protein n=1 Tax=Winogradskyella sp. TaxID=1883156 RepID=UPI00262F7E56|nr:cytochrome c biogenesis protein CcdA [Winogradskyella sp.]
MKKKIIRLVLFLICSMVYSQTGKKPIQLQSSFNKISDLEYDLIIKAKIAKDWHLYSQYNPDGASLPLEITSKDITKIQITGKAKESKTFKEYSEVWEKEEIFFKDSATITQRVKLVDKNLKIIKVNLFAQVCKKVCINIDEDFVFQIKTMDSQVLESEQDERSIVLSNKLLLDLKNKDMLTSEVVSKQSDNNLSSIFFLGFFGGLLALLTPCVFPMIPLTVSFFTKSARIKKKGIINAMLYGLFIVLIYLLLSLPFHTLDTLDPEILNEISTNVWLNIFFFVILVVFAFSFFGFYEITLPSSWSNKMDSVSNVGGVIGIFFMSLTLAIVSFSCTGPILGSLLAGSLTSESGATQLTIGMLGFGLALALPFALFALFPNWLNSLPKSGGWLNSTKVVLGFLELAFAFKFLSNADLVQHWGILKREVFIGIWIVIFILLALYLFKKIKFPHDDKDKAVSFSRITLGILVVSFIIYLIPGTLKNPTWNLNLLSGFPPPQFYSLYEQGSDCPLGLDCYKDFDEGIIKARESNKPILLDFTGWACVNCRKMEENVWTKPSIHKLLKENFILISLYVDDRKRLKEDKKFQFKRSNGTLKDIETIGAKWATFQALNFKTASQPYYVLISPDLKVLNSAIQYADAVSYENWLRTGIQNRQ